MPKEGSSQDATRAGMARAQAGGRRGMDSIRTMLDRIGAMLGGLTATQRLLVASLGVIAVMALFLMAQYASRPSMVDMFAEDPTSDTVSYLRGQGFRVDVQDGRVLIDPSERAAAMATLATSSRLPDEQPLYFNSLIEGYDWKAPREHNHQRQTIAIQNELARIIREFPAVASAHVILDRPERGGLGRASTEPAATVTLFASNGGAISQNVVDAVASLVSGAVSGLSPARVSVVDGQSGKPRKVTSDDDLVSSSYLEHQRNLQREKSHQIETMLSYIPGVKVTVSAHADVTRVRSSRREHLPNNQGSVSILEHESSMTSEHTQAARGGEPGLRSNTEASIVTGAGAASGSTETTDETSFATAIGTEERVTEDPRGMPTFFAATVLVPQNYIADLIRSRQAADAPADGAEDGAEPPAPTAAEIAAEFELLRPMIEQSIRSHVKTQTAQGDTVEGEITVAMYAPVMETAIGVAGVGTGVAMVGPGGSMPAFLGDSPIETALIGLLAIVAVVLMLMLVRRSGKAIDLPKAEDLVGIPAALQAEEDLIGEAGESDSVLEGIELRDDQFRGRQVFEQVAEMVRSDPETASRLLGQWIKIED